MSYGMYATVFLSLKNTGGLLCMFMTEKTVVDELSNTTEL